MVKKRGRNDKDPRKPKRGRGWQRFELIGGPIDGGYVRFPADEPIPETITFEGTDGLAGRVYQYSADAAGKYHYDGSVTNPPGPTTLPSSPPA